MCGRVKLRSWFQVNEKRLRAGVDPVRCKRIDQDAVCLEDLSVLVEHADSLVGEDGLSGEMPVERAFADISAPGGPTIAQP